MGGWMSWVSGRRDLIWVVGWVGGGTHRLDLEGGVDEGERAGHVFALGLEVKGDELKGLLLKEMSGWVS